MEGSPASTMADCPLSSAIDSHEVRMKQKKVSQSQSNTRLVQSPQSGIQKSTIATPLSFPDLSPDTQGTLFIAETSPKPSFTQSNVYPHRSKPILHSSNSNPSIATSFIPVDTYQFGLKSSNFSGSPNAFTTTTECLSTTKKDPISTLASSSKTSPNSSRQLQEVFQKEGERLQREEKIASMVQSFEAELKKSGMSIDLSQLTKQINFLQEGHNLPKSPSRYMEGDFIVVYDPPSLHKPSLNRLPHRNQVNHQTGPPSSKLKPLQKL